MSKVKLSPKQKEVVAAIRDGKKLYIRFSHYVGRGSVNELDGKRINQKTFDSLKNSNVIVFDKIDISGMTKHYYKLTELGQSIEL